MVVGLDGPALLSTCDPSEAVSCELQLSCGGLSKFSNMDEAREEPAGPFSGICEKILFSIFYFVLRFLVEFKDSKT